MHRKVLDCRDGGGPRDMMHIPQGARCCDESTMPQNQLVEPAAPARSLAPNRAFPPFGALRAFDTLAQLGSVSAAAAALSVNRAMINRHVRALESWTGATLIRRTRNAVELTEEGRRYYELLTPHIDGIAQATLSLLGQRHDDRLNIWCVPGFGTLWLMPRIARFRSGNPGVSIELRSEQAMPNFSRHDADVAIRYVAEYGLRHGGAETSPAEFPANVRVLELARIPLFPVASPDYLARSGPIATPKDLIRHVLIKEESDSWQSWLEKFDVGERNDSGPQLWQTDLALNAAVHGQGIALADYFSARDELAAGRLVEVTGKKGKFPPFLYGSYVLLARPDRWSTRPVARFRHWIADIISSELESQER